MTTPTYANCPRCQQTCTVSRGALDLPEGYCPRCEARFMLLAVPTVHLNGTDGEDLLSQVREASRALRRAREALTAMTPNARDYYVQGNSAFDKAAKEHGARHVAIGQVQDQLDEIFASIAEQVEARQRSRS